MKNWRTTLGGAVSTVGKGLIAMTVLPQLAGNHDAYLWYLLLAGYIINIVGEGLSKLWAADAKTLKEVAEQTNTNSNDIAAVKSDTSFTKNIMTP